MNKTIIFGIVLILLASFVTANIALTCQRMGGTLTEINGTPSCILNSEEKARQDCEEKDGTLQDNKCIIIEKNITQSPIIEKLPTEYMNPPLAEQLYPQNPKFAGLLLMVGLIGILFYSMRGLTFLKKEIKKPMEDRSIIGNMGIVFITIIIVLFFNFIRMNITRLNYMHIGDLLWESFPLGGWILTFAALTLSFWILTNIFAIAKFKKKVIQNH